MHCKLTTDDLFTDGLSTDLATDFATNPFAANVSDGYNNSSSESDNDNDSSSDSSTDAGNEEVCSSGLSSDSDISSDGTEVSPLGSPLEEMPKTFQAPWAAGKGEAGNFVELSTRGGIMEYDAILKQRKLGFIRSTLIHYMFSISCGWPTRVRPPLPFRVIC